jgi:hypothetical protein
MMSVIKYGMGDMMGVRRWYDLGQSSVVLALDGFHKEINMRMLRL